MRWKQIGMSKYYISDAGLVRNHKGHLLRQRLHKYGYYDVILTIGGKKNRYTVHRLVASYFIPNPELKPQVNHIDLDKQNNHFSNLEWVTEKENISHYIENTNNNSI